MMFVRRAVFSLILLGAAAAQAQPAAGDKGDPVDFQWGVKIPLRDGVKLNATLYRPQEQKESLPCVFTLTPYIAQSYHDRGMYFAAHGYVFLAVDVRGRGNSEGEFTPMLQEAKDGSDVVEWLAGQSYCNGKVAMWGGSYAGYDQWAAAKEFPPHLATIVPVAAARPGVDFPFLQNIFYAYDMQWLTLTSGHASQERVFGDTPFWAAQFDKVYLGHRPFKTLDGVVGNPSAIFQAWVAHPQQDAYWDSYSATAQQFAKIDLPILTITGQYDDDQSGAMSHYRGHLQNASEAAKARHYLIIGPWDHAGTRTPSVDVGGLKFGPASLLDMNKLHKDWYDWTMKGRKPPEFLKDKVAYYVLGEGAEEWRYAASLAAVTAESRAMYLASDGGVANDVYGSGRLSAAKAASATPDRYVYDPLDTTFSLWDDGTDGEKGLISQKGLLAASGKLLVYHTAPLAQNLELAGFPTLGVWLALDQPDTDIGVILYEIRPDGSSVQLGTSLMRARYRKSLREPTPVKPGAIERYDFGGFPFIARRIGKGSRLRLVIAPTNSKQLEKNYNAGGVVAEESGKDARTVTVKLYHDEAHPSALYLPISASSTRH
jgi:putative CocE/NonD family hydrolase